MNNKYLFYFLLIPLLLPIISFAANLGNSYTAKYIENPIKDNINATYNRMSSYHSSCPVDGEDKFILTISGTNKINHSHEKVDFVATKDSVSGDGKEVKLSHMGAVEFEKILKPIMRRFCQKSLIE